MDICVAEKIPVDSKPSQLISSSRAVFTIAPKLLVVPGKERDLEDEIRKK